jgi:endo-1,4-beta-xylanase
MSTRAAAITAALTRPNTLAYYAAQAGLAYGDLAGSGFFTTQLTESQIVANECSIICNTQTTPSVWRPSTQTGTPYFGAPDAINAYCQTNNQAVFSDGLIVHGSAPSWVTNNSTAIAEIQSELSTIMGRYATGGSNPCPYDFWTIVNEGISVAGGLPNMYRSCDWNTYVGGSLAAGTDYITQSFLAARAADPNAQLVYGDELGSAGDGAGQTALQSAVLSLVTALKQNTSTYSHGLVDGVMMQCHRMCQSPLNVASLKSFMDQVYALGLNIHIVELDCIDQYAPANYAPGTYPNRDYQVAKQHYDLVLNVAMHPGVKTISSWGWCDPFSWLNGYAPRADGNSVRPCLLDQYYQRKPAYYAVRAALQWAGHSTPRPALLSPMF